jgi:hypothetical protein
MIAYVLPFWLILPCLVVAAFLRGGAAERRIATLYAVAAIASFFPATRAGRSWIGVETWILFVDVALLVALLIMVVRYGRWWIILATSLQTISALAHLARLLDPTFDPVAYSLMEGASSYPTLILLGYAIWRSWGNSSAAAVRPTRRDPPGD